MIRFGNIFVLHITYYIFVIYDQLNIKKKGNMPNLENLMTEID